MEVEQSIEQIGRELSSLSEKIERLIACLGGRDSYGNVDTESVLSKLTDIDYTISNMDSQERSREFARNAKLYEEESVKAISVYVFSYDYSVLYDYSSTQMFRKKDIVSIVEPIDISEGIFTQTHVTQATDPVIPLLYVRGIERPIPFALAEYEEVARWFGCPTKKITTPVAVHPKRD